MSFELVVGAVALLGGVTAAVSGAGIGSMLVPLFALRLEFKVAVAVAALPHLVGGAIRLIPLRRSIDWSILRRFGVACAVAALVGALLSGVVSNVWVTRIFAVLLGFAGLLGLSGIGERLQLGRVGAWLAGAIAGFTGGLAGEQGGIRAVALLHFKLSRDAFIATTTAVGVAIDLARTPVYASLRGPELASHVALLGIATGGVVVGTLLGISVLRRIPEKAFGRVVSFIVLVLAVLLLARPPSQ
jgi:uncharacterized membrane protein YfcA